MQVQTVSADTIFELDFDKDHDTLAVMMGGGQFNSTVKGTTGETYVGDCAGGFMTYSDYVESNTAIKGYNENAQWYVRLHGSKKVLQNRSPSPSLPPRPFPQNHSGERQSVSSVQSVTMSQPKPNRGYQKRLHNQYQRGTSQEPALPPLHLSPSLLRL
jgi:hypothetical protein